MTGKKSLDLIILGLATLMSAAVLGVFVYTEMVYQKPLPEETEEKKDLMLFAQKQTSGDNFKIDKIIINLNTAGSRLRFLDLELYLVPFKARYNDIFEQSKPYINDAIIDVASDMAPEELNSVAGKILLQGRIRKRLNRYYEKELVKEIYFTRFVVQ